MAKVMQMIFNFLTRVLRFVPYGGVFCSNLMRDIYFVVNFVLTSFNRFVIYNLYEFLRRFISRAIEFRCDRQSSKAFGGHNMALALSMLGEGGYFTLFSTHPRTLKRIEKVQKIKTSDSTLGACFVDSLANYFSIMFLMIICLVFAKQAEVDLMVRAYLQDHEIIHRKLLLLWNLIKNIL